MGSSGGKREKLRNGESRRKERERKIVKAPERERDSQAERQINIQTNTCNKRREKIEKERVVCCKQHDLYKTSDNLIEKRKMRIIA